MNKKVFSLRIYNLLIPLVSTFLLFILSYFFVFIPSFENSIVEKKKELIKEITISAWDVLDFYKSNVDKGVFSLKQAQELAKSQIENIRYGNEKKDYLWIIDNQPKMIMHPYKNQLDNQDLSNYKDSDGRLMFNKMVQITKKDGEGYLEYNWQLKDDSLYVLPKLSFVKAYVPWGWIVGTGVYLTDINNEVFLMKKKLGLISLLIGLLILSIFVYIFIKSLSKEKLLIEVETKYKKLFNSSNDAIVLLKGAQIVDCNPKALNLFNCNRQNIINKSISEFSPEYQPQGEKSTILIQQIINECILGKSLFFEWVHLTSNKKQFVADVSLNSVEINDQILIMSSIRDITLKKNTEKRLLEALEKAETADKLKSSFLANMSHEIRTPMNGILGFSHLLKNDDLKESQKIEFINIINSKGNQLLQIINDIIDISKIESHQIKVYYSEFSINKLFDEINESFMIETNEIVKSNIQFEVIKDLPDSKSFIKSDRNRILQILHNLVSNAFKFSEKGKIKLGYKIKDSEIEFYVQDEGIGIKKDEQDIIFEHFRQSDGSSRRLYGGTGLGLSISKGLVQLLGGEIGVESDGLKGSRFFFTIPYKFVSGILEFQGEPNLREVDWSSKNILVVEDDIISFEFIKEILSYTKVNLKNVKSGDGAILEIKQNTYDLVLMDIQLSGIDGYDTTREIRKINPDIPIIAQTANAFAEDRNKSLQAGCNDYMSKPINEKLLLKLINYYI